MLKHVILLTKINLQNKAYQRALSRVRDLNKKKRNSYFDNNFQKKKWLWTKQSTFWLIKDKIFSEQKNQTLVIKKRTIEWKLAPKIQVSNQRAERPVLIKFDDKLNRVCHVRNKRINKSINKSEHKYIKKEVSNQGFFGKFKIKIVRYHTVEMFLISIPQ